MRESMEAWKITRTRSACLALIATAVLLFAGVARVYLHADEDPDLALYNDDVAFSMLSSGGQERLILKFGPKPSTAGTPSSPIFGFIGGLLPSGPADPPPTNVLVNNLAEDLTAQDTQSETSLVLGAGSNIVVGFNDSGSFTGTPQFTGWSLSTN